ncbi:hypothetical protein UNDKW_4719 [Undibacterium sp. KW1]|uniref:DUF2147 domain-containing protein n=1 Tax=Undibacterium sp. KW1 TaxID=2058624 RepID=UPI001331D233|nr:DUF2147 domain-containing protein [Undibacterium sp. KW1]BBB62992.1 hypothetical protein UNDKW_4719 [Undibacterium sp. KW1]
MKKQMIVISTFATVLMSAWSAQAQQAGLSDYYLAPVEAQIQANNLASGKAGAVAGTWLTQSGSLEVQISNCGDALCGKVSKVNDAANLSNMTAMGSAATPASAAPVLGKTIMEGFTPGKADTWSGKIFNRADGQTYACQMRMLNPTELEVTAYKDKPENGRTQVWTRVSNIITAQK